MNDGLAPRFRRRFGFERYTPAELAQIAVLEASKDRHSFSDEAKGELGRSLAFLHANYAQHPAWSNGRVARTGARGPASTPTPACSATSGSRERRRCR
jgi:hypothetical protein